MAKIEFPMTEKYSSVFLKLLRCECVTHNFSLKTSDFLIEIHQHIAIAFAFLVILKS